MYNPWVDCRNINICGLKYTTATRNITRNAYIPKWCDKFFEKKHSWRPPRRTASRCSRAGRSRVCFAPCRPPYAPWRSPTSRFLRLAVLQISGGARRAGRALGRPAQRMRRENVSQQRRGAGSSCARAPHAQWCQMASSFFLAGRPGHCLLSLESYDAGHVGRAAAVTSHARPRAQPAGWRACCSAPSAHCCSSHR
jgi:hypothetical protein